LKLASKLMSPREKHLYLVATSGDTGSAGLTFNFYLLAAIQNGIKVFIQIWCFSSFWLWEFDSRRSSENGNNCFLSNRWCQPSSKAASKFPVSLQDNLFPFQSFKQQHSQMVSSGFPNACVIAIEGDFDVCQNLVSWSKVTYWWKWWDWFFLFVGKIDFEWWEDLLFAGKKFWHIFEHSQLHQLGQNHFSNSLSCPFLFNFGAKRYHKSWRTCRPL